MLKQKENAVPKGSRRMPKENETMSGTWKKMAVAAPAVALILSGAFVVAAAQEANPTTVAPGAKTGEVIA